MSRPTIVQHFLQKREKPTNPVALRFKRHKSWIEFSWEDYYRRAEALAHAIHAEGLLPGDRVAVLSGTRVEWATLDFAILGLGLVTVPIYQSLRPEEVDYILANCEARLLFIESTALLKKCDGLQKRFPFLKKVVVIDAGDLNPHEGVEAYDDFLARGSRLAEQNPNLFSSAAGQVKLDDLASIVYTSGTTGRPRGVEITHRAIVSEVEDIAHAYPVSSDDSTLTFLPYAHVLGRVELWLHTYLGFTMSFAESLELMNKNLKEVRPTVILGVPRIFEKIHGAVLTGLARNPKLKSLIDWMDTANTGLLGNVLALPRKALLEQLLYKKLREGFGGRLRFTVSGGAPLEPSIAHFFREAGFMILEGYGLTETTAAIVVNVPGASEIGSVGKPMRDVKIKLATDGEILVKSEKVMRGYYKDPEATAAAFVDGYFATGDVGEWSRDGFLRITDRKKDLIKTAGGKFVAPQKLEGLLKTDPLIANVLIHGDKKRFIVALVTLDPARLKAIARENDWNYADYRSLTQSEQVSALVRKTVAHVNAQLASFETVKNFAILDHDFTIENGELTPSLKVKRKYCDEKYKDVIEGLY